MKSKITSVLIVSLLFIKISFATTPKVDNHIKVDQFGYRTNDKKIAVISNPQIGYNKDSTFSPGTTYQVRRYSDNAIVFSGSTTAWNSGATHLQSGDKVWWFDFSSFVTPGSYYIFDVTNNVASYQFDINDCIYNSVMKQVLRMYYYQRCGTGKVAPYAQTGWTDTPCHIGKLQDADCRLYKDTSVATSKNLAGGWHDAGDYNKYVNYTFSTLIDLLLAYAESPTVWGDNYNIPESGNGVPDILDEVKYELRWLLKMQNADGSVLSMVGVPGNGAGSPPSTDNSQRVYGPASTSASLTAATVCALGSIQFKSIGDTVFANTLQTAAIKAWNWAVANPKVSFYNAGLIEAGEQEIDTNYRFVRKVAAASFLFGRTGDLTYKTFFENNYTKMKLFVNAFAFPDESAVQSMLLYYASLPGATPAVANNIKKTYSNSIQSDADNLPAYLNKTDAYRAFLASSNYGIGSLLEKANQGSMYNAMITYNLDAPNNQNYKDAAEEYVHYFHGVNPTAFCYMSNMGAFGAENSINEIYHVWFTDGSAKWDRVGTSTYGPPPGFIPLGPDSGGYSLDACCLNVCSTNPLCNKALVTPPLNQPPQKSYKDWNTGGPQNSWNVTEVSIYGQASYVRLFSKFLSASCILTGVDPVLSEKTVSIHVFPNPFASQTTILFNAELKNAELKVFDILGQEIKGIKNISGQQIIIDRGNLTTGIYYYKLAQDNKLIATGKLIAE